MMDSKAEDREDAEFDDYSHGKGDFSELKTG